MFHWFIKIYGNLPEPISNYNRTQEYRLPLILMTNSWYFHALNIQMEPSYLLIFYSLKDFADFSTQNSVSFLMLEQSQTRQESPISLKVSLKIKTMEVRLDSWVLTVISHHKKEGKKPSKHKIVLWNVQGQSRKLRNMSIL